MAKKQTRRSISVSRQTYERLKAYCDTNNISMSQFVETRVGDYLGGDAPVLPVMQVTRDVFRAPSIDSRDSRPVAVTTSFDDRHDDRPVVAARPVVPTVAPRPAAPAPSAPPAPLRSAPVTAAAAAGMSLAAAARAALEPRIVIAPSKEQADAKPPSPRTADQIFTF